MVHINQNVGLAELYNALNTHDKKPPIFVIGCNRDLVWDNTGFNPSQILQKSVIEKKIKII